MAQQWTVVVEFDSLSVRDLLAADSRVAFARTCGPAGPKVVWVAIDVVPKATVTWMEAYGLYASKTSVEDRAVLHVQKQLPLIDTGVIYRFGHGTFACSTAPGQVPPGHIGVSNLEDSAQTFGLLQAGAVDGLTFVAPINAVVLPSAMTADFFPSSEIYLWTQPRIERGSIVVELPENAAAISFESDSPSRTYRFDRGTRHFVRSPSTD